MQNAKCKLIGETRATLGLGSLSFSTRNSSRNNTCCRYATNPTNCATSSAVQFTAKPTSESDQPNPHTHFAFFTLHFYFFTDF